MPLVDEFMALSEDEQEEEFNRLFRETIKKGAPGVKETAYIMGLKPSKLYKWGSNKSDKVPRPHQLIKLMRTKKNLLILYFLNDLFELTPFKRPKLIDTRQRDIGMRLSMVFREVSWVCQTAIDLMGQKTSSGLSIAWERFREGIISAHEQIAALEEAIRLKLVKE